MANPAPFPLRVPMRAVLLLLLLVVLISLCLPSTGQQVFYNASSREMWNNRVYISWQNITHVYESNSQNMTIDVLKYDDNGNNDPRDDADRIVGNIQNDTAHGIGFNFSGVPPETGNSPWGTVTRNPDGSATVTLVRTTANGQATAAYTIFPNSDIVYALLTARPTTTTARYYWGLLQRCSSWLSSNPGPMLLYDRACLNTTTLVAQTTSGTGPHRPNVDYLLLTNQLSGYAGLASTKNAWTMGIVVRRAAVPFDLRSNLVMQSPYGGWGFSRDMLFEVASALQPGRTYTFDALIYNDKTGNFQGLSNVGQPPLRASGTFRQGSTVTFSLSMPQEGGTPYLMATSLGTGPVSLGGGKTVGVSLDWLAQASTSGFFPATFVGYAGSLNSSGVGSAQLAIPAKTVGVRFHTAFVTYSSNIRLVSNTCTFDVLP